MRAKEISELSSSNLDRMKTMDEDDKAKYLIFLAACDDASDCRDNLEVVSCNSCLLVEDCKIQKRQEIWKSR
jgi:hypothetical protein